MPLLLIFFRHWFHVDNLCTGILCDLFDLKFPEVSRFNLDLPFGYRNDAVLRRFNTLADFLAFSYINFHIQTPRQSIVHTARFRTLYTWLTSDIPVGLHSLIIFPSRYLKCCDLDEKTV